MDLSTLQGLLQALLFPVFLVNWIATNVLTGVPLWDSWSILKKSLALLALSIVVAVIAYVVILTVPGSLLDKYQPFYAILYTLVMAWLGGAFGYGVKTISTLYLERQKLHNDLLKAEHQSLITRLGYQPSKIGGDKDIKTGVLV